MPRTFFFALSLSLFLHRTGGAQSVPPELEAKDATSLLAAAKRYEEKGQSQWVELCCRRILKLPECPEHGEAGFLLASIELKRGRYETAYARLRDVRDRFGHPGARDLLAKAENDATRRQREALDSAEKSLKAEKLAEARKLFVEAYKLAPEKLAGAAFVPRENILPRIARCVDLLDDENYKKKVQPVERDVVECGACREGGGFQKCTRCQGSGIWEHTIRMLRGVRIEKVPCPDCAQIGWVFCPKCLGLEYAANKANLGAKEEKAVVELVNRVRALPTLRMPLESALKEVEGVLLKLEESAALTFFRALKPRFTLSKALAAGLGKDKSPPEKTDLAALSPKWANPENGLRGRANFLFGYACRYADYLRGFDMLRNSQKRDRVKLTEPPVASGPGAAVAVDPGVLSAFPDEAGASWVAVQGNLDAYSEEASDFAKGALKISGAVPHNVNFFVWRPEAAKHLERLEKGPWGTRISGLAKGYPYSVAEKCRSAPKGRRVTLVGRFLRDRLGYPRNWFEVWDLEVGLTPEQEKLLRSVEEPVEVAFPSIEAGKLASFIRVWYGLEIAFEGVDRRAVLACEVTSCPLGLFIDATAKALGAQWVSRKGRIVITKSPDKAETEDVVSVVGALSASAQPERKVSVRIGKELLPVASTAGEKLPESPAALAQALESASQAMQYDRAVACCDALLKTAKDATEKSALTRKRARFALFQALTHKVPVSHLAGASDLSRLEIRNAAGEANALMVRVLERGKGFVILQPSYGGKAQVKSELIRKEEPVSAKAWRDEKEKELDQRAKEADAAAGKERAQKLFLLAVAAKTNAFAERGTALLEKAAREDELSAVIETYYPDQALELGKLWRIAEGKTATPPEVAALPSKPAAKAKPAMDAVKLPDPLPPEPEKLNSLARQCIAAGRKSMSRSLPGMDEATAYRKRARDQLEAARTVLDRLLELDPRDVDAIHLKRDVAFLIQTCVKDLGFFD